MLQSRRRCRDVSVDQVIEQTGLIRTELLAALGKLQPIELRDLVGQFLVECFVVMDLLVHRLDFLIETPDALDQLRGQCGHVRTAVQD